MLKIIDNLLKPKFYTPTRDGGNLLDRALIGFQMNNLIVLYDNKVDTYIKKGYQGNAMVYSIIQKLSEKRKEATLNVMRKTGKSSKSKYKALKKSSNIENVAKSRLFQTKEFEFVSESDPFLKLIKKPNPKQNTSQFIEDISKWWDIAGEFFIYGFRPENGLNRGKITEMYVLPANLMEIIQGDIMNPIIGYKLMIGDQSIVFPPEDIKHVKSFNPEWNINGIQERGQPPLMAGTNLLQKNNAGIQSAMRNNENDGAKGVLSPDGRLGADLMTSPHLADLKQKIENNVNGLQNKAKVVPSGLPMQYTSIGLSPVALDLIKGLEYDDEKLCSLWGVNPVIFKPTATQANLEIAQKALVTDCCLPFLNMVEQELTEWLGKEWGADYVLDFDTQSYAELQPDVQRILDSYGKSHLFTGNEVRPLLGFDESEDPSMNIHWIPSNLVPSSEAMANPDFGDFEE
jgi:HK97 family phage portal protein